MPRKINIFTQKWCNTVHFYDSFNNRRGWRKLYAISGIREYYTEYFLQRIDRDYLWKEQFVSDVAKQETNLAHTQETIPNSTTPKNCDIKTHFSSFSISKQNINVTNWLLTKLMYPKVRIPRLKGIQKQHRPKVGQSQYIFENGTLYFF